MEHSRHYTLEQATLLLPRVGELLEEMRSARAKLGDREAREALTEAAPTNGGGTPGRTVSDGFLTLRNAMIELRELELVVRDLDRGLVDFPSRRGDQEIYLCWEEGEQEIAFWHGPEDGFAGRRPLSDG
jgi:hypothetical protein